MTELDMHSWTTAIPKLHASLHGNISCSAERKILLTDMQICGNAMPHLYYTPLPVFLWLRLVDIRNATVQMIRQESSQKDKIRSIFGGKNRIIHTIYMYVHTKKRLLNFQRQASQLHSDLLRSISHIFDTY